MDRNQPMFICSKLSLETMVTHLVRDSHRFESNVSEDLKKKFIDAGYHAEDEELKSICTYAKRYVAAYLNDARTKSADVEKEDVQKNPQSSLYHVLTCRADSESAGKPLGDVQHHVSFRRATVVRGLRPGTVYDFFLETGNEVSRSAPGQSLRLTTLVDEPAPPVIIDVEDGCHVALRTVGGGCSRRSIVIQAALVDCHIGESKNEGDDEDDVRWNNVYTGSDDLVKVPLSSLRPARRMSAPEGKIPHREHKGVIFRCSWNYPDRSISCKTSISIAHILNVSPDAGGNTYHIGPDISGIWQGMFPITVTDKDRIIIGDVILFFERIFSEGLVHQLQCQDDDEDEYSVRSQFVSVGKRAMITRVMRIASKGRKKRDDHRSEAKNDEEKEEKEEEDSKPLSPMMTMLLLEVISCRIFTNGNRIDRSTSSSVHQSVGREGVTFLSRASFLAGTQIKRSLKALMCSPEGCRRIRWIDEDLRLSSFGRA
uniref:Uncharacterized protein n=2 Tax=Corethron hystrix TaxID=216773 RepID=A0A7S1G1A2_9STRA|mmetsp:Transcript_572/g.1117  ORF Transcript_572/g.1117 Transcript_572/m.1117 type:complete len:484 (+) Transcript_572:1742-3193(+)